jgi:hypothetical protein
MGALYQIGRNGAFAGIYNFSLGFPSPIVADQAGNVFGSLYVPTSTVRSSTAPTAYVYELVPSTGAFTVLASFDQSQGAPLITSVDRNDNLYGTPTHIYGTAAIS